MGQNITEDPYKKKDINDCEATSVFNKIFLILDVMKEDLEHRKKYLKWCAKSWQANIESPSC